jgi:NAD(P)H-flavin reductase
MTIKKMDNPYQPTKAKILKIRELSPAIKLFRLKIKGSFSKNKELSFIPGQFVLAGILGYGESPFGPASSPYEKNYIDIVVRKAGNVTSALHNLSEKDEILLRGPYGNGFPLNFIEKKDIVLVTGGCGIPPIAALIEYIIKNQKKFGRTYLIYGAKTPEELLFKKRIERWEKNKIKTILTIDKPVSRWKGPVGMVSEFIDDIEINPANAVAAMCGPGPMMDALEKILRPLGISDRRIFVNMERKMQCGIGKCQHCTTGDKYVCLDGPVFYFDQIDKNYD